MNKFCEMCSNMLGDKGVYYLSRHQVCQHCFQNWLPGEPKDPRAGLFGLAAGLMFAALALVVAWALS